MEEKMLKCFKTAAAVCFTVLLCTSFAQAGVEPSPFKKREVMSKLEQTIKIIQTGVVENREMADLHVRANNVIKVLQGGYDQLSRTRGLNDFTARSITYCYDISTWLNPQPEPPSPECAASILNILDRVSAVAFNPQPEPPATGRKGLIILARIEAVLLNPQPEPPAREQVASAMGLMDRISAIAFNPQPEPPALSRTMRMLDILDRVSAVAFNPQPEPPAREQLSDMFDAIDMMSEISLEQKR